MSSRNAILFLAIVTVAGCKSKSSKDEKSSGTVAEKPKSGDTTSGDKPAGDGTGAGDSSQTQEQTSPEPEVALTYPVPDPELGEALGEDEIESAALIAKEIEGQIKTKYPKGSGKRALRDAHPKAHGCLKAEFKVDPEIKPEYAHGVFSKGNSFDAIVRFSNTSKPYDPDIKGDGRGMSFKLLNVPGKKILENETQETSQDFIMISHPVFFIADSKKYVDFIKYFENSDAKSFLATSASLGPLGMKIALDFTKLKISSPIQIQYWSNVPYQLGVGAAKKAVKYTAKPCAINGKDSVPEDTTDNNYLRTRLVEHFKNSDACMDIFVQERTSDKMSVEDSRIEWTTPWSKVATLTMKKGEQTVPASADHEIPANKACDSLSMNPWHSLPEHKPLGSLNRIRKSVYVHISKLRHELNGEERKEPKTNTL